MPTPSALNKCGPIRRVTFLGSILLSQCIRPDKKGSLLGGSSLIRGMVFGRRGHIRLLYLKKNLISMQNNKIDFFLHPIPFCLFVGAFGRVFLWVS